MTINVKNKMQDQGLELTVWAKHCDTHGSMGTGTDLAR